MYKKLAFLLGVFLTMSCNKTNDEVICINGYTPRDSSGIYVGVEDKSDWGKDGDLPKKIWTIFDSMESPDLTETVLLLQI